MLLDRQGNDRQSTETVSDFCRFSVDRLSLDLSALSVLRLKLGPDAIRSTSLRDMVPQYKMRLKCDQQHIVPQTGSAAFFQLRVIRLRNSVPASSQSANQTNGTSRELLGHLGGAFGPTGKRQTIDRDSF